MFPDILPFRIEFWGSDSWDKFLEQVRIGFDFLSRIRGKKHDAVSAYKEIKARFEAYIAREAASSEKIINDKSHSFKKSEGSVFATKEKVCRKMY